MSDRGRLTITCTSPHLHLLDSAATTRCAWLVGQSIPMDLGFVMVDKPKKKEVYNRRGSLSRFGVVGVSQLINISMRGTHTHDVMVN